MLLSSAIVLSAIVAPLSGFTFGDECSQRDRTCWQQFLARLSYAWGERILLASKRDAIASETIASLTAYAFRLEARLGAASYENGISKTDC
ncbi:MAG: hypothetical protein RBJ76_03895 [Stenomitos frigidus ULC029]